MPTIPQAPTPAPAADSATTAQQPAWPAITAPHVAPQDHWIEQLGRRRNDDFAWLKYIPETGTRSMDNLPEPLGSLLQAERDYAQQMLAPQAASAQRFYDAMAAHVCSTELAPPAALQGWAYSSQPGAGGQRVFVRSHSDGRVQTLVDEAVQSQGHRYYRATDHQASPDERYYAWAEDLIGNDRHRICVLDTETGQTQVLVEGDAFGYGGLTFSPSSQDLFWIWRDAHSRPSRLYRSALQGGQPVLVHEESDPALFMRVARTAANGFVVLSLFGPDTSELHLIAAGQEHAAPRLLRPRERGIRYEVNEWNGSLVALTNAGGATDRQILRLGPDLQPQQTLAAHRHGVPIIKMQPFASTLVRLERADGLHQLVLLQRDGAQTTIRFDEPAYTLDLLPGQHWDASHVRIKHQTPAQPPRWLDIRLADGQMTEVGRETWSGLDPANYRIERLQARADDGQWVPLTVLSRKDIDSSQPQPLLLTGYGAYGIAHEASFSLPALAWVDAGYRYAIAHVRGGSEKGHDWYQGGCREHKRNSMTDFIACAQHLQQLGYSTPQQTVAHGISAGGLLVCGAMNMQPQHWAGVIAQVPFVDMLNTMSDADHPLVPLLRPDWGDPLADPVAYDYIAALSPYENVREAAYPPLLCTAGLKDDRVPYWEPAKLMANVRRRSTSAAPALLLLNPDSGHQESDQQESVLGQAARLWAFAQHCATAGKPPAV